MPQSFADYLEIGEIPIIEVAKKRLTLVVKQKELKEELP